MTSKPVVDTKQGIDPLWSLVPQALAGKIRIAPGAYDQLVQGGYAPGGGASDNWDEVAAALDLFNLVMGQPATAALDKLAGFLTAKLADRRWMQKEFGSWVYIRLHVEPTILQWRCAQRLALTDPATWTPIADGLRGWLRAAIGWLAVTACWGPGRTWIEAENKRGAGARLFVGTGDFGGRAGGGPHCVLAGKRSWDLMGTGWYEGFWPTILLSSLGLNKRYSGDVWKAHKEFLDTVAQWSGSPLDLLGADEAALVLAASKNDLSAMQWCVSELIRDWLPAEPIVVVRADEGVSITLLAAGKSPTPTVYHSGWGSDGTTYVAGADPGWRGGHAEGIERGHSEIYLEARTGWCQRVEGDPRPRVDFPLPKGNLVAVIEAQQSTGLRARYYRDGVEISSRPSPPAPAPQPGPTPRPKGKGGKSGCALFFVAAAAAIAWVLA